MRFYSLKNPKIKVNFKQALFEGLAPDGSLYFPESFPQFSKSELKEFKEKSLKKVGFVLLKKWLDKDLSSVQIKEVVEKSLDFSIPIKKVGPYQVMELFHGPTMAFKDIAAGILAQLMNAYLKKEDKQITILVATSGDTGGAIAQGFSNTPNVKVAILFPKGRVSKLQERQLTRVSKNIFPLEIEGSFDDCQKFIKQSFLDPDLKNLNLTSANSINIGRLIPQSIYYLYAYAQLQTEKLEFIVPSGNMGSVTAGLFARKMGLPFKSFIIAENSNDSVVKYYQTGNYQTQVSVKTLSSAMDIGNPSNFVRILEVFGGDYQKFKKVIKAISIPDSEVIKTIKEVYRDYNYLLDPHSAVGWDGAEKLANPKMIPVLISTASPVKFAEEIEIAAGIKVDDSKEIKRLQKLPKRKIAVQSGYEAIKKVLKSI